MAFKNYSDAEAKANARTLLPKGSYSFTVKDAFDQDKSGQPLRSSKGNAMIKLMLHVQREGGGVSFVDCYLTDQPSMAWLARHLAETTGTLPAYDDGMWDARVLVGTRGIVAIDIEGEKPKNDGKGGMWPAKNIVKDFGQPANKAAAPDGHEQAPDRSGSPKTDSPPPGAPNSGADEDVPFNSARA